MSVCSGSRIHKHVVPSRFSNLDLSNRREYLEAIRNDHYDHTRLLDQFRLFFTGIYLICAFAYLYDYFQKFESEADIGYLELLKHSLTWRYFRDITIIYALYALMLYLLSLIFRKCRSCNNHIKCSSCNKCNTCNGVCSSNCIGSFRCDKIRSNSINNVTNNAMIGDIRYDIPKHMM